MTNLPYNRKRTQAPTLSRCCCLLPLAQKRAFSDGFESELSLIMINSLVPGKAVNEVRTLSLSETVTGL